MRSLELFAGAGGAALGLRNAGAEALACIEWNADACATLTANGFPAVHSDVRDVDYKKFGKVDLLWASPPCQAWSRANQQGVRGADDVARNGWPWTLEVIAKTRPTWVVCENVRDARKYVEAEVLPKLRERYPFVAVWQLNAKHHGVPQSRNRIFIVAGPAEAQPPVEQDLITMRAAIGVAYDRPSPCVMTNEWKGRPTNPIWWKKLNNASDALAIATEGARRKLTTEECATLQGFPPSYKFMGTPKAVYTQIGNAVPPPLASAVITALMMTQTNQEA